jgi:hypothetical protein
VSLSLVRRSLHLVLTPRSRALAATAACVAIAAACSGSSLAGPESARLVGNLDGRASGPSGLEQRVVTKVEAPPAGSPYRAMLTATSNVSNTGSSPVRVRARVCFVQQSDVESSALLDRLEPFVTCAAESMELDLAPGQSTGPLQVQFGVRSGPGEYTLKLRHSLVPEFRAEAPFTIP